MSDNDAQPFLLANDAAERLESALKRIEAAAAANSAATAASATAATRQRTTEMAAHLDGLIARLRAELDSFESSPYEGGDER